MVECFYPSTAAIQERTSSISRHNFTCARLKKNTGQWTDARRTLGNHQLPSPREGPQRKGSIRLKRNFPEKYTDYFFPNFLFRLKDLVILDCRSGFSRQNYTYDQLEWSGGKEYGENPTNGLNNEFYRGRFS